MELIAKGIGVSSGIVQGRVWVVKEEKDYALFNEGDILVTYLTDPTMVPLMNRAAAIICDIGGLTSHPSIVARELGIACIVSAKDLTTGKSVSETFQSGMMVQLNGETGEIFNISSMNKNWKLNW